MSNALSEFGRIINGQPGAPGANGNGVKSLVVDANNHLITTYDDNTTKDAGEIDVTVPIDDSTASSSTVYSSSKVEELVGNVEDDVQDIYEKISTEYTVGHPRIVVRKGKNAILNISNVSTLSALCVDMSLLEPSTKYYVWCKPSQEFTIAKAYDWFPRNGSWRGAYADCFTGTVSTDGQWVWFKTSEKVPSLAHDTFEGRKALLQTGGGGITFENMCAVKESDWSADLEPYTDNSGYCFMLNCSLSAHDGYKDRLVQRDGKWYKTTTHDDTIVAETSLDGTDCAILSAVANLIKNNANYGYTFSLIDESQNVISDLSNLVPEDIDYIRTADYRFLHKDREFIMHSIGLPHEGCMDYGNTSTLLTSHFHPFEYFDVVALGFNTVQISIDNAAFLDGSEVRDPSDYACFTQAMNFATALGLRIIFKFYTFKWDDATKISQTLTVEKLIVDMFKDYPNVVGYSLANEPGNNRYRDSDATIVARYEAFIAEMQNYIRANTKQIVFVERDNGVDYSLPNTAYEEHMYKPHLFTHHAACSYPNLMCLFGTDTGGEYDRYYYYTVTNEYPVNKTVSPNDEFSWISTRLYAPLEGDRDSIFQNQLRIDNTAKLGETFDIKAYSYIFYDADQNVIDEYTVTFDANTDLTKYYLTAWTSGDATDLDRDEYLSIIQEDDEYALRLSIPNENTFKYIQLSKQDAASSEYYDMWTTAFVHNAAYAEFRVLARARTDVEGSTTLLRFIGCVSTFHAKVYTLIPSDMRRWVSDTVTKHKNTRNVPLWIGESGTLQTTMRAGNADLNGFGWLKDVFGGYAENGISYNHFIWLGASFGLYNTSGLEGVFDTSIGSQDEAGEYATIREINQDNHTPNNGYSTKPTENDFRPLLSHGAWEKFESIINDTTSSSDSTYSSEKIDDLIEGVIDDTAQSLTTTYSSEKIDERFGSGYSEYLKHLSDGVNVKDYGAKGDGTTNDSQAFINAMTAATTANKTVILVPSGSYNLNHTVMDLTGAFTFIGATPDSTVILNSCIYAPYGITCENLTFDGGTARANSYYEAGWSSTLYPKTVALLVTPQYANADVVYKNCVFENVDLGSVAFHAQTDSIPIVNSIIHNCVFKNIDRVAVFHSTHITHVEVKNSIFNNIGNNEVNQASIGCLKLGDTTNSTDNDVEDGIIENNIFDTLKSYYDTTWASHVIACSFITVMCEQILITHNTFKNADGYGADREGVYTKGNDVEICYNTFIDAGQGEGYIGCKGRQNGNRTTKIAHVHHNNFSGEYGEAIRIYGSGDVHDNYIAIKKLKCAIRFFAHSNAEAVKVYDNFIYSGIGQFYLNGTAVTDYDPTDGCVFIQAKFEGGIQVNNNVIYILKEDGYNHSFQSAIKIQKIAGNVEVCDNVVDMAQATSSLVNLGSDASYPNADKNVIIKIANNYLRQSSQVGVSCLLNASNTYLKVALHIEDNIFDEIGSEKYAVDIGSGSAGTVTLYYSSTQPQNAFPKRHVYGATDVVNTIYTNLTAPYFLVNGSTIVNTDFKNYMKIETLKTVVAASSDFADFQTRIAAL